MIHLRFICCSFLYVCVSPFNSSQTERICSLNARSVSHISTLSRFCQFYPILLTQNFDEPCLITPQPPSSPSSRYHLSNSKPDKETESGFHHFWRFWTMSTSRRTLSALSTTIYEDVIWLSGLPKRWCLLYHCLSLSFSFSPVRYHGHCRIVVVAVVVIFGEIEVRILHKLSLSIKCVEALRCSKQANPQPNQAMPTSQINIAH